MYAGIDVGTAYAIIIPCCCLGLLYALFNTLVIRRINVLSQSIDDKQLLNDR